MAVMNYDELLEMLKRAQGMPLAARARSVPNRQSWDPALNPPDASTIARGSRGAAIAGQPLAQPLSAGRQGGPPPLPATQGPRFVPKSLAVQPGIAHVGRAGMPAPVVAQAGYGRGARPPAPVALASPVGATSAPAANWLANTALPGVGDTRADYVTQDAQAPVPATQAQALAAPPGKIIQNGSSFRSPDDAGTVTLADARNAGKSGYGLSVIGMGLSPEATVAKLKDQTEQARQLNRMKETGLSESELAKVDARRAKDSEIFQLTQQGHSPTAASAFVAQRDAALAKQTAETPTQIAAGQQALASGAQTLQKGALELKQAEQDRSMLDELFNLDPAKPESKTRADTIIAAILAGKGKTVPRQKEFAPQVVQQPVYEEGIRTGTNSYAFNPNTMQSIPMAQGEPEGGGQGGAQAAPPEAVAKLMADPTLAAAFQAKYGYLPPGIQ